MADAIQSGDRVLLRGSDGRDRIVIVGNGTERVPGLGVLKMGDLAGRAWGSLWKAGGTEFRLLRPVLTDFLASVDRGAQVVLAKDASRIVFECGLRAGSSVLEAGVGSGALTIALANAVAPTGRVHAYDVRDDHLDHGRKNVRAAGLDGVVAFAVADVTKDIPVSGLDAIVLDLPTPDEVVKPAWGALRSGGVWASYSPQVSQVERTVAGLRDKGFLDVRTLELLERGWVVGARGSRPETNMLAHTGFLTFARRP